MSPVPSGITSLLDSVGLRRDGRARSWLNSQYTRRFGPTQKELAEPFTSYSQFGEDAFLNHLLSGRIGTYIDVGAGHPIRGSNTYALYERGWSGLLVEPLAENVELAREERPRDQILQACCGSEVGTTELLAYTTSVYSTTDASRVAVLGEPDHIETCEVVTLASLGLHATPSENVLLNIDVEGMEEAVLDGNDWASFTPGLVIVEEWEGPLGHSTILMDRFARLGYELIGVLAYSSVYRHREWDAG